MKRSASLRLVLMGSAALTLSGCDESVDAGVFETVEQCTVMGYSQSACEKAIAQASEEHLKAAPRYATKADCEAEFGRCESPTEALARVESKPADPAAANTQPQQQAMASNYGGGSFFMPMMAGYMIGRMMSGPSAMPLYQPRQDYSSSGTGGATTGRGYYTGGGERVSSTTGLTRTSPAAFRSTASTTTLSRGGFGARAQSVSVAS